MSYAIEKFPKQAEQLKMQKQINDMYPIEGDIIRTEKYVADECKKLAEQLKEFEEREE